MQISGTSAVGLLSDIDFLCQTNATSYKTEDKIRNINNSYHEVSRLIRENEYGWQYDDANNSDLPIATTTLVHGQQDYELPDGAQDLNRAECLTTGGDYVKLTQMDWNDVDEAMTEFKEGNGLPEYYDLIGDSVMLYPAPSSASVTTAAGLKLYFNRDITEFPASATTASPGFATPFHRILSLDAAIMYEQDPQALSKFTTQRKELVDSLKVFYGHRDKERPRQIKPAARNHWAQYE